MRVVVDTNVFVSAALKESSWPAIAVRWVDKYGTLLKSPSTEQEVIQVLQRPRFAPKILPLFTDNLLRMFAAAELVTITERVAVCRDPKDDKFGTRFKRWRRSHHIRRCRLACAPLVPQHSHY